VRCDHTVITEVDALRDRLETHAGRLDVLVNDIWGSDALVQWGRPFWEHDLEAGLRAWRNAVETHLITSHRLAPLLVATGSGLVIEVTDGDSDRYRGSLFYDLAKASAIRLAVAQAAELAPHGGTAVSLTPGFLRSEAMLDHFGVREATWREAIALDPHFALSETPAYVGRAAAALACDPAVARWNGRSLSSWALAREYGFRDDDGSQPDWGRWWDEVVMAGVDAVGADDARFR
jgi:NAD(P)-dependent dehydrogenase (short-subunit alcohol dehydrogenase family)